MSVTTIQSTLQDYEIHVTGDNPEDGNIDTSLNTSGTFTLVQNAPPWPRDHRRIPNYRPINRNLNFAERPNGSNGGERAFLFVMFTGVAVNAGIAQIWSRTGGKMFTKVFRYAIGGEW